VRPKVFPVTLVGLVAPQEARLVVREDDQAVQLEIQHPDGRTDAVVLSRSQWAAMMGASLPFGVLDARMLPLRPRFEVLCARWLQGTGHLSDPKAIVAHPACRTIVEDGMITVPLILGHMRRAYHGHHGDLLLWDPVLREITQTDPVPGSLRSYWAPPLGEAQRWYAITKAWIAWGVEQGLID
jgi:hypothetical protein